MRGIAGALESIALTLWVGGMWAIGFVAAPVLFARLPDRIIAGWLAGTLFTVIAYVGIVCAVYLLLSRLMRHGAGSLRQAAFWIILLMLVLTVAGEFAVQPILHGLKTRALSHDVMESVFRDRFNTWHGVASTLYVIQGLLGAGLVVLAGRGR